MKDLNIFYNNRYITKMQHFSVVLFLFSSITNVQYQLCVFQEIVGCTLIEARTFCLPDTEGQMI